MKRRVSVPDNLIGQRIDTVLAQLEPLYSRASWQKLIGMGSVSQDGSIVTKPSQTTTGQPFDIEFPGKVEVSDEAIPIIYQDEHILVINKPAGILTHAKGQIAQEWTVADFARHFVTGDSTNRPGIVHRLDRPTSGVLIIAKDPTTKAYLQTQFADRRVVKTYRAILHGVLDQARLDVSMPITRNPKKPATFMTHPSGKMAQTTIVKLAELRDETYVTMTPQTGRTHQLRVHAQAIGHPIVGDPLYGRAQTGRRQQQQRLFLHAYRLELTLPNGQAKTFTAPLPEAFAQKLES